MGTGKRLAIAEQAKLKQREKELRRRRREQRPGTSGLLVCLLDVRTLELNDELAPWQGCADFRFIGGEKDDAPR